MEPRSGKDLNFSYAHPYARNPEMSKLILKYYGKKVRLNSLPSEEISTICEFVYGITNYKYFLKRKYKLNSGKVLTLEEKMTLDIDLTDGAVFFGEEKLVHFRCYKDLLIDKLDEAVELIRLSRAQRQAVCQHALNMSYEKFLNTKYVTMLGEVGTNFKKHCYIDIETGAVSLYGQKLHRLIPELPIQDQQNLYPVAQAHPHVEETFQYSQAQNLLLFTPPPSPCNQFVNNIAPLAPRMIQLRSLKPEDRNLACLQYLGVSYEEFFKRQYEGIQFTPEGILYCYIDTKTHDVYFEGQKLEELSTNVSDQYSQPAKDIFSDIGLFSDRFYENIAYEKEFNEYKDEFDKDLFMNQIP